MELLAGEPDYIVEHVCLLRESKFLAYGSSSTNQIAVSRSILQKCTGIRGCIQNTTGLYACFRQKI